jgi:RNA polymerase sigma-70 factor (ECF subfamily)
MKTIPSEIFEELYKREYRKLCAYAYRFLKDEQRAEDAAQEAFFRLTKQDYEKLEGRLESWIYTVCRNCSFKQKAKDSRFVEICDEDVNELDESRTASEQMDLDYHKKILKKCMRKLTKRQRDVLKLRFFNDLDYNESAKKLKTTSGNIGFHQTTAIQKLRKMMMNQIHE